MALTAHAAPVLSVLADSQCPSQIELEEALTGRGLVMGASSYVVATQTSAQTVVVRLVRNGTGPVLTREFAASDCHAAAEAAAVVVEAYFLELADTTAESRGEPPGAAPTASAQSVVPAAPVPPVAPANDGRDARSLPSPQPPTEVGSRTTGSGSIRITEPFEPVNRAQHSTPIPIAGTGAVGIGTMLALPEPGFALHLEAQGGIEIRSFPLSAEVQVAASLPRVSGDEPNRVSRWSSGAQVRLGVPWGGRNRYCPWLGVGLSLAQLKAIDLTNASTKSSTAAVVAMGFEISWPVAPGWAGRLDLSCTVFTLRESYRVQPDGEIGSGPRVVCGPMLGLRMGGSIESSPVSRPGTPRPR